MASNLPGAVSESDDEAPSRNPTREGRRDVTVEEVEMEGPASTAASPEPTVRQRAELHKPAPKKKKSGGGPGGVRRTSPRGTAGAVAAQSGRTSPKGAKARGMPLASPPPAEYRRGNRRTVVGKITKVVNRVQEYHLEKRKIRAVMWQTIFAMLGLFTTVIENAGCFTFCESETTTMVKGMERVVCEISDVEQENCTEQRSLVLKGALSNLCLHTQPKHPFSRRFAVAIAFRIAAKLTPAARRPLAAFTTLTTIVLLCLIWREYKLRAALIAFRNHVEYNRSLIDQSIKALGLRKPLIIECLVLFLHVPPFISFKVNVPFQGRLATYRIEAVLAAYMWVRLYLGFKLYRDYVLLTHRTKRFAGLVHTTEMNSIFVVKNALREHALPLIGVTFGAFVVVTAYLIRVSEASVQGDLPSYFWNCCWFIVVTMTSVGYGDYNVISHMGRTVAVIAMLSGAVISSVLTAAVYQDLSFTSQEYMTMNFLNSRRWHDGTRQASALVIQRLWRWGHRHLKTKKAIAALQDHQRNYSAWKNSEPHFGKLMQDAISSTREVQSGVDRLATTVADLQHSEHARVKYVRERDAALAKMADEELGVEEEEEEDDLPSRDMALLLSEMETQRRLVEQLLRSVIFLSTSRQKDNDVVRGDLVRLQQAAESYVARRTT